jgi:cytochrome c oxidase subunit II
MTVGKFWSLVFLLVPFFGVGVFIYGASPSVHIWLPPDVSEFGHNIDHLFMFILWLTGAVFIVTEGALFWFLWKYNATDNPKPAKFVHGSHSLEIVWTILPAATLLFIAIYQMNAWADSKMRSPNADDPNVVQIEVKARQFEWRLRYPGRNGGKLGHPGELFTVNDLHVPVGKTVLVHLKSEDVLHSFFLPNMRVKQDAVPGMTIPVWFRPMQIGIYDLPCAELCGWGHYKMKGRLTVQSESDYEAWLADLEKQQNTTMPPAAPKAAEGTSE